MLHASKQTNKQASKREHEAATQATNTNKTKPKDDQQHSPKKPQPPAHLGGSVFFWGSAIVGWFGCCLFVCLLVVEVKNKRLRQRLQWCGRWFCKVVVISGVDKWRTKKKKKKKGPRENDTQERKPFVDEFE